MKKALLLCAAALFSLIASAGDGLVSVGANVILLPSSYWDGDIEWKAMTWVYNTQTSYGDWNSWNPNYNQNVFIPCEDADGLQWYEPGFDMGEKEEDINNDTFEPILWEEHRAPFSTDEYFTGIGSKSVWPSYQWTSNSIMADIYVRRTLVIPEGTLLTGPVYLACGHDDAPAEYYINGELVFERTGWEGEHEVELKDEQGNVTDVVIAYDNAWNNAEYILLDDDQKALLKLNGEENVIAFHVHQNWGGAFADCGLYTKVEGGLDMGYTTPWEGKVLFNGMGGYNNDMASPSNNPRHPWSALYEAQEGDVYTFTLEGSSNEDVEDYERKELLQFKTPIKIEEDRTYSFKARIKTDKPFTNFSVILTDNDFTENWLVIDEGLSIDAPEEDEEYEGTLLEYEFDGLPDVNNFMIEFDFGGGQDSTTVSISEISLRDITEGNEEDAIELWVGTSYFNYFDMHKIVTKYMIFDETLNNGEGDWREAQTDEERENADEEMSFEAVNAPEITGRVETMAWTQADFDDSMWDDQMMPVGNKTYMPEVQSNWPGYGSNYYYESDGAEGHNTNYWIRRTFEMDEINQQLSYELNVCHDDVYETYVNGHLLQKNVGWTNGKSPVQVHIPAKYLNVGKNVIATYIQQNWGGRFYDCGINVTEVNYAECVQMMKNAIAYAETDTVLTNKMKQDLRTLIAEARAFLNDPANDAAELRNYSREMMAAVNAIFAYSPDVKVLKSTYEICRKMEDKGYWGTALTDAVAALDTCATDDQLTPYLNNLRYARKATAMERHTENYVGCTPEATTMDYIGDDMIWGEVPKYYIYNVGAKNFLGGGEAWGSHQALEFASNPMMLIQATRDVVDEEGEITGEDIEGVYYIETFRPNGDLGVMDFLGWNGFVDVNMGSNLWELIPVEGKPNVYNIAQFGTTLGNPQDTTFSYKSYDGTEYAPDSRNLLGLRNGGNNYAPSYYIVDTDLHDPAQETNQWMFISREEMLSFIQTASEANPADLTFLINNPGYDQRWTIDDWYFTGDGGSNGVWGRGGDHPNFVLESYASRYFNNEQSIYPPEGEEALPEGTYMLTVQGYYRDGIEGEHIKKVLAHKPIAQRAIIYAGPKGSGDEYENAKTMPLAPIHIEANKVPGIGYYLGGMQMPGTYNTDQGFGAQPYSACEQAALDYFGVGLYENRLVFTIDHDTYYDPSDDWHIWFGIYKDYDDNMPDGDWIVMDNWRLKYYGNGDIDPDAIKGIESDEIKKNTISSKSIYNMLGQKLSKPQKGVNIIEGKKIIKK